MKKCVVCGEGQAYLQGLCSDCWRSWCQTCETPKEHWAARRARAFERRRAKERLDNIVRQYEDELKARRP